MPTNIWLGTSLPNAKVMSLHAGANITDLEPAPTWKLGLGSVVFTFTGWDVDTIVSTWNGSSNPFIQDIVAAASGDDIIFTCNNLGQDFELTCDLVGGVINESSTYQTLGFDPAPSGGTFTLTIAGSTTGNIAYSATPATFASNMHTAIAAMMGFSSNDVLVTYSSTTHLYTFDFSQGRFAGTEVDIMTATHTSLTGGNTTVGVVHSQVGNAGTSQEDELTFPLAGVHTEVLDEIQTLETNANSGTFNLSLIGYGTTGTLPYSAGRSVIQAALSLLVGSDNVLVSGGPLYWSADDSHNQIEITFQGDLAGIDVPQLIASVLTGGTDEVQLLTMTGSPTGGTFTLTFGADTTGALPYTATPAVVQTALTGLASIGAGNLSVVGTPFTTVTGTPGVNEQQQIAAVGSPTAGTFTITFSGQTTTTLNLTSTTLAISAAIQSLSNIGSGNVVCTGGPLLTVTTTGGADAVQQVLYKVAYWEGTFTLSYGGYTTAALYVNSTAAQVQAALEALTSIGSGNVSCTCGFTALITPQITSSVYQTINIGPFVSSGTFTLSFGGQTTSALAYNASTAAVLSALSGLSSISGHISMTDHTGGNIGGPVNSGGYMTVQFTGPLASSQPLITSNRNWVNISGVGSTSSDPLFTPHPLSVEFIGTLANQAITLMTSSATFPGNFSGGSTGYVQITTTTAGHSGTNTYTYNPIQVTFQGTLAALSEPLFTYTVVSGSMALAITEIAHGSAASSTYVYGSMTATFQGAKANLAEALITSTPSLTGGTSPAVVVTELTHGGAPVYTVNTVQDGGLTSVENISGGTFSLNIAGTIVDGIPYNVTATNLASIINARFGSTVVTVTGGPAPYVALDITFVGTLQKQPITVTFLSALTTNTDGSVVRTVLDAGRDPVIGTNVYDLVISPGNGTLGVMGLDEDGIQYAQIVFTITNTLASVEAHLSETPVGQVYVPLITISAFTIQNAINEALACDACRVVQIGRSQEWANVEIPAGDTGYGGTAGDPVQWTNLWYYRDVYRITFLNQFADPSSMTMTATFPVVAEDFAKPTLFMHQASLPQIGAADPFDLFSEEQRVLIGFTTMENTDTPLHECTLTQPAENTNSVVGWRFKLQTQYITDGGSAHHTGLANYPSSGQVRFVWNKKAIGSGGSVSLIPLVTSVSVDWNSPASVFRRIIGNMFFGVDNIQVEGSLNYSWLSESLLDAPGAVHYQDLKVTLVGQLHGLPIDEFEYDLTCEILHPQFDITSTFQKNFRMAGDYYTRSLPPHLNKRERILVSPVVNPITLSVGISNSLVTVAQTSTVAQVQAALDSLYPLSAALAQVINSFPIFPPKLVHPVFVYGTTWADGPMEFEFSSLGLQESNDVGLVVSSTPQNAVVGLVTVLVQGVNVQDDIQLVTINGHPYSGTWTLTHGANTTAALAYNISLSSLATALAAASPAAITYTSVTGSPSTHFTFNWAAAGGPQTILTDTSSLNNVDNEILIKNLGGADSTFVVTELTKGRGPFYLDDSNNFSLGRVLNSNDTFVADDSASPIMYGLDQSSIFKVLTIGSSPVVAQFIHTRRRKVFDEDQTVLFKCTGTPPTGLTADTVYTVVDATDDGKFSLALTGTPVSCTTIGSGTFELVVSSLTVNIHNQFGGARIGLPHLRNNILEYLPCYWKAYFSVITIGIGSGNGLGLGRFDTMDNETEIDIGNTASTDNAPVPTVLILANNNATTMTIGSGDVGVAYYAGESSVMGAISIVSGVLTVNNAEVVTINKGAEATFKSYNTTVDQTIEMS